MATNEKSTAVKATAKVTKAAPAAKATKAPAEVKKVATKAPKAKAVKKADATRVNRRKVLRGVVISNKMEKTGVVERYVKIRVDYREFGAFFKEQQMRYTVVDLVVADRRDVRREHVHQFYRGKPHEFRVYDGAAEHIAGVRKDDVFFLFAYYFDVSGHA